MTEEVRSALLDLVAAPAGEEKVRATRAEAAQVLEQARRTAQPPGKEALAQRIFGPTFRAGAGPGPSAARITHILVLARLQGGVDAARAFARRECRGLWAPEDAARWHAAILFPHADGDRPAATRDEAQH